MNRTNRVLIVEDEPSVRLDFHTALESPGLELATAEDGEAALGV
jgi:CheY-like chemotaxis protein